MFAAHRCGVGAVREGILGGGKSLCRAAEAEGDTAGPVCLDSLDSVCGSWSGLSGEAPCAW